MFAPETTHLMSYVFDDVCRRLGVTERNNRERDLIAMRIITLVEQGECDGDRLRRRLLQEPSMVAMKWSSAARRERRPPKIADDSLGRKTG